MKNRKLLISMGIVAGGLLMILGMAVYVIPQTMVSLTKAAPATRVSIKDSYILGEKILARADGKDICRVNVFVLDNSGKGVAKKSVVLSGMDTINPKTALSDNDGKASFEVTSATEGQFRLRATVDGAPVTKEIKVTFRNEL